MSYLDEQLLNEKPAFPCEMHGKKEMGITKLEFFAGMFIAARVSRTDYPHNFVSRGDVRADIESAANFLDALSDMRVEAFKNKMEESRPEEGDV